MENKIKLNHKERFRIMSTVCGCTTVYSRKGTGGFNQMRLICLSRRHDTFKCLLFRQGHGYGGLDMTTSNI